jgi:hypothetical protein
MANLQLLSTKPEVNFATGTAGVVQTGGKFATRFNDTGGINGKNIILLTPSSKLEGNFFLYLLTLLPKGVQTK